MGSTEARLIQEMRFLRRMAGRSRELAKEWDSNAFERGWWRGNSWAHLNNAREMIHLIRACRIERETE